MDAASMGDGNAASGLERATWLKRSYSSAISRRRSSGRVSSDAARADSIIAYCSTGAHSPASISARSTSSPAGYWWMSGSAPSWLVSVAAASSVPPWVKTLAIPSRSPLVL